ncbi:uncharacterized protein LOC107266823 isoform X2 [Cephus cinctus]|uniref:Uncharacterized protein LOC107266823 isoform X2 n=1 Tax=Cephus cinctus TaxID=211228 RepID=A0AAJ7W0Q8_CEPCN|nr:uncharacterized protein LOC107266823 isoform X2 [Cephus cinctus]
MSSRDDGPNENSSQAEKVFPIQLIQETKLSKENEKFEKKDKIKSTLVDGTKEQSQSSSQNEKTVETVYAGVSTPSPVSISQKAKEQTNIEDDPCIKKEIKEEVIIHRFKTPGLDPRFQQQNQTMRCYVMYTDFYRCEKILGEDWIRRWDEHRAEGRFPWFRYKSQGKFPGDRYGDV